MNEHKESAPAPNAPKEPSERIVVTEHSLVVGRRTLAYTATCGTVVLRDYEERDDDKDGKRQGDKPRATLFFTAYTLKGVKKPEQRPVTFSFNGGPGSSSALESPPRRPPARLCRNSSAASCLWARAHASTATSTGPTRRRCGA